LLLLLTTAAFSGITQSLTSGTSYSPPTMPSRPASATSGGAGERTPIKPIGDADDEAYDQ
jgi:hypothetical protein